MSEPVVVTQIPAGPGTRKGRTIGIVSAVTVIVAVVGYLREASLAARFGVSPTMDAYFAAMFIPGVLYAVLIAGTLSPIFIPILMQDIKEENLAKTSETFSIVTNFTLLMLLFTVALSMVTARIWLPLLFSGFGPATGERALQLIYIIFPAVLFLGLAGIFTAVLNGFHKFAIATFAPALSSAMVIGSVILAPRGKAIYIVGAATALGFLLQFLVLVPATRSLGIRYRAILNFRHPAIGMLIRLGFPLFLYLTVANASLFLERNLASRLSAGGVSAISYALRLFAVPANFLAAPLATVLYPEFARRASGNDFGVLRDQVSRTIRLVIFLFLPITIWVILNALPLTRFVYERGQFRLEDSIVTSRILMFFSIGILPNAIAIVLLRCFFAVKDTVTPLIAELIDLAYYIVAASLLTRHFGLMGLAAARGGTFFVVGVILIVAAWKRLHLLKLDSSLLSFLARVLGASLTMTAMSWSSFHVLRAIFDSGATLARAAVLLSVLLLSGGMFLATAYLLQLQEARQIFRTAWNLISVPPKFPGINS